VIVAFTDGRVSGKPGEGIQPGSDVVVRPFAEVAINYDSNPLLLPKGQELDDLFLDVSPGVNVTRAEEALLLEGIFWARFRQFMEFTSEDRDDWSEELRLAWGRREAWRLRLHERFGRVSDYDLAVRTMDAAAEGVADRYLERPEAPPLSVMERSERVDRELLDCGVGVGGPLTDKTALDVIFDYGSANYLTQDLLDSTEAKVAIKAARKITDKTSALLVVEYIQMKNDSLDSPASYYAARAGLGWRSTFKSRFEATVGYSGFGVSDPNVTDSLDRDGFSYDVAWYWQARPKLSMTLGGRSEMQLAPDTAQNAKLVNMLTSSIQYSATQRLSLSLLVGYRHEDFIVGEELASKELGSRLVEQIHGRLHCDYQLFKWLKGYGELWLEDTTDNVRGDYVETRATLGVKAQY
jgi:hypothetical protein